MLQDVAYSLRECHSESPWHSESWKILSHSPWFPWLRSASSKNDFRRPASHASCSTRKEKRHTVQMRIAELWVTMLLKTLKHVELKYPCLILFAGDADWRAQGTRNSQAGSLYRRISWSNPASTGDVHQVEHAVTHARFIEENLPAIETEE